MSVQNQSIEEVLEKKYILNPCYIMRCDINRIILTGASKIEYNHLGNDGMHTFIHPIHAMMLSFFKGEKELRNVLSELCFFFDMGYEKALALVQKFINNKNKLILNYDGDVFYFPPRVLIENDLNYPLRTYNAIDFNLDRDLDFVNPRFNIPIGTNLLINTRCATDCIYCYADKYNIKDCTIPFGRLKELIQETKVLGFEDFDIQGGELFLYTHWYELLRELFEAGYSVYLSTKIPLQKEQINKLKELNVKEIQVSLDSIFADDLIKNLRVNEQYVPKILDSIINLNKEGIKITLKPVITAQTFDIQKIERYVDHFSKFKNLKKIDITAPGHSHYKTQKEFFDYRLSLDQIDQIKEFVEKRKSRFSFILNADVEVDKNPCNLTAEERKSVWKDRAICTGNLSSFLILPNGDVTLCEEAYFNKKLIMGNILNNSIMDVWNSEKAKSLFFTPKEIFPKDSACSSCVEFEDCRYIGGVCWVDVIGAYGEDNWLYPDPRCPLATKSKIINYCE